MLAKKIVFVTTHSLATNPRVYKEAQLALQNNYAAEIVCFEYDNWSYAYNQELKQTLTGAIIHTIPAGRKPVLPWLISSSKEWLYRKLNRYFPLPQQLLSGAISKRSVLLINKLRKIKSADLVIAHNPAALWPAIWLSKKIKCKAGFDMEDYHPGEGRDYKMQQQIAAHFHKLLPLYNYVSFASPLIKNETEKLLNTSKPGWITVLNYFPAAEFEKPDTSVSGKIKLVWFSQNIKVRRGLELVMPYIRQMSDKVELHLIGSLQPLFAEQHLTGLTNVIVHPPCSQQALHRQLSSYDIGLALDIPVDRNRELAVTNKILAYLQAGLFVIATDTPAHKTVMDEYADNGICFSTESNNFSTVMENAINDIEQIRLSKNNRYANNRNLSWENESALLLNQWQQLTNA